MAALMATGDIPLRVSSWAWGRMAAPQAVTLPSATVSNGQEASPLLHSTSVSPMLLGGPGVVIGQPPTNGPHLPALPNQLPTFPAVSGPRKQAAQSAQRMRSPAMTASPHTSSPLSRGSPFPAAVTPPTPPPPAKPEPPVRRHKGDQIVLRNTYVRDCEPALQC